MKIIFAGTPEFAVPSLLSLINSTHEVCAVYTQPDRRAGRGQKLSASPIKQIAHQYNIPVEQPLSLRDPIIQDKIRSSHADIMIVIAYGSLLPRTVLDIPKYGCINIHASLLPRWRGAAPIQRSILANDEQTGITIMQMDAGLDTGPILSQIRCSIEPKETSQSLYNKLSQLGSVELIKCLKLIKQNKLIPIPQRLEQATYAEKITKDEAHINWQENADYLERMIRAFNPRPVAFTTLDHQTIRIWQAETIQKTFSQQPGIIIQSHPQGIDVATGSNILRILKLQFPGSNVMEVKDALNSRRTLLKVGAQLS